MDRKKLVQRWFARVLLGFVAVFLFRWAFVLFFTDHDVTVQYGGNYAGYESGFSTRNIATNKVVVKDSAGGQIQLDQKYDKTAQLAFGSKRFDDANRQLREVTAAHEAVIQTERLSGLAGSQRLEVSIGVIPDRFDELVDALRNIGELRSFSVNKLDKTDEYRALTAEIATLENALAAYQALGEQGGSIQERLLLQERIVEVERSLQEVGVKAGLFTSDNSFCTINLTLQEAEGGTLSVRFVFSSAMEAFYWTLGALAILMALLVLCAICSYLFVTLTAGKPQAVLTPEKDQFEPNPTPKK